MGSFITSAQRRCYSQIMRPMHGTLSATVLQLGHLEVVD